MMAAPKKATNAKKSNAIFIVTRSLNALFFQLSEPGQSNT